MDLLFPLLIVFMIGMIFFSNRQRKKQQNQQESLQNSIAVGDVVLMTSGISGTVVDTDDERTIDLEIAPDVITTWLRAAVREKLSTEVDEAALLGDVEDDAAPTAGPAPTAASTPASTPASTTAPAAAAQAPTAAAEPKDARSDQTFADPTATPGGNGVSAGSQESRNN